MKIPVYMNGLPAGEKELPAEMIQKCYEVAQFMNDTGALSIYGIGPVFELQRQLAEALREKDIYRTMDQSGQGQGKFA